MRRHKEEAEGQGRWRGALKILRSRFMPKWALIR
jgi:hypothetical protein